MNKIMDILPSRVKSQIEMVDINTLTEIRLRVNKNLCLRFKNREDMLNYIVNIQDITDILKKVSSNSIYSIQNEINNGYITAVGGNRIGIVGEVVIENGKVINIKNISSMNIRICHEIIGAGKAIMSKIYINNEFLNTLIVSPPGCGKTTILRDIVRIISDSGKNVGLVDERHEIASVYNGIPTLDVGKRTDVITNIDKAYGINILTRSMGLDVIATDEIGSKQDVLAVKKAIQSGIKILATAHGNIDQQLPYDLEKLVCDGYFDVVIYLSKNCIGNIEKVCYVNKVKEEVV